MAPDQGASLMLVATVKEKFRFGDEEEEEEGGSVLGPHKSNTKPTLASLVSLWTPLLVERLEEEVSAENSDADDEMLSSLAIDLLELLRSPCAGIRHTRAGFAQRACLALLQKMELDRSSTPRLFAVALAFLEGALALRHASTEATAFPRRECEKALQLVCSLESS